MKDEKTQKNLEDLIFHIMEEFDKKEVSLTEYEIIKEIKARYPSIIVNKVQVSRKLKKLEKQRIVKSLPKNYYCLDKFKKSYKHYKIYVIRDGNLDKNYVIPYESVIDWYSSLRELVGERLITNPEWWIKFKNINMNFNKISLSDLVKLIDSDLIFNMICLLNDLYDEKNFEGKKLPDDFLSNLYSYVQNLSFILKEYTRSNELKIKMDIIDSLKRKWENLFVGLPIEVDKYNIRDFTFILLTTKMTTPNEVINFALDYISEKIIDTNKDADSIIGKLEIIPNAIYFYICNTEKISEPQERVLNRYKAEFQKLYSACLHQSSYSKKISFEKLKNIERCEIIKNYAHYFSITLY
ncbi:MAG: hypothetical protein QW533_06960 [Thermoplasmata archaeon]